MTISPFSPRCACCGAVCATNYRVEDGLAFCQDRCLYAYWGHIDDYIKAAKLKPYPFERAASWANPTNSELIRILTDPWAHRVDPERYPWK